MKLVVRAFCRLCVAVLVLGAVTLGMAAGAVGTAVGAAVAAAGTGAQPLRLTNTSTRTMAIKITTASVERILSIKFAAPRFDPAGEWIDLDFIIFLLYSLHWRRGSWLNGSLLFDWT